MDFSNRNVQTPAAAPTQHAPAPRKPKKSDDNLWTRIGVVAAAVAIFVLLAGVVLAAVSKENVKPESDFVETSKLQAVFLNTGQVYFGNIKDLNNKYIRLTNIYYLQTSGSGTEATATTSNNSNVSLVKLGCELHEPYDLMVINREQVTFWENLGDNGQVAKAVKTFEDKNPNGQKCADQSSAADTNGNSVQNANNGSVKP